VRKAVDRRKRDLGTRRSGPAVPGVTMCRKRKDYETAVTGMSRAYPKDRAGKRFGTFCAASAKVVE